jgi:hypothetical protein
MRIYVPLCQWLRGGMFATYTLSFAKLEQIIGFPLPDSARNRSAWWANENAPTRHVQCEAWLDAGFKVAHVDPHQQIVEFQQF